ncbi:hypothetical protein ACIPW9_36260 [Streptomyces sp. NPDC090052]|uniref:hypothetical protein n=1 Tax=Streptomyces sp. NPDC090052 TaxID=3365931 RepID=UPI0037FD7949
MTTKTKRKPITIDQLIAEYAAPIATAVGLDDGEYDSTAEGLAGLLRYAVDQADSQTADFLEEAASDLDAVARLGGTGSKTQKVLKRIDGLLYEAKSDLELI